MVTVQKLAEAIHEGFQSAKPEDRWQAAARAAIACLNSRPTVAAILGFVEDGTIVEIIPKAPSAKCACNPEQGDKCDVCAGSPPPSTTEG